MTFSTAHELAESKREDSGLFSRLKSQRTQRFRVTAQDGTYVYIAQGACTAAAKCRADLRLSAEYDDVTERDGALVFSVGGVELTVEEV